LNSRNWKRFSRLAADSFLIVTLRARRTGLSTEEVENSDNAPVERQKELKSESGQHAKHLGTVGDLKYSYCWMRSSIKWLTCCAMGGEKLLMTTTV
jgi:hypothetical protein